MTPNERMEQSQWDTFWVPREARVVDRPELLYLTCPRPVFYLNQVLRTRPGHARWSALVDEVRAAHAHSTSCWLLFDTIDMSGLERPLSDAGYELQNTSHTMVTEVSDVRASQDPNIAIRRVCNRDTLLHSLAIMDEAFGVQVEHPEAELTELLRGCIGAQARIARLVAYTRSGQPIATGCMNLYPALNLAYLWGGSTLPEARGRGAYSALLRARVALARQLGMRTVGVYALTDTSAPILAKHGYLRCGTMNKWQRAHPGPLDEPAHST